MAIDPTIEGPLRKMLGHAIRHELDELAELILAEGETVYGTAATWCIVLSGYIAIDVSERWPAEGDLRAIASHASQSAANLPVTEDEIYTYLSRVVLGFESPLIVFADQEKAAMIPLFATADLLLSYGRQELDWSEYLDLIWDGIEVAEQTKPAALPALMYRVRSAAVHAAKQAQEA
jgi:hypothetical protein